MGLVDNSPNNHRLTVKLALSQIRGHLEYFNDLAKGKKHRTLANCAWVDLVEMLRKKMPAGVRELARSKLK